MNARLRLPFTFSLLLSNIGLFAQFHHIQWHWDSTEVDQQVQYWDNGAVKAKNQLLGDQLFRFQYYENGQLQLKAAISQHRGIDTIITYDPETLEQSQVEYKKVFGDWPNGTYQEFFPNGKMKADGQLEGKKYMGKWLEYWENGHLKREIHYNSDGLKAGPYREYYESGTLKVSGAYGVEMIVEKRLCLNSKTYQEYECEIEVKKEVRTGEWSYYDESGKQINNQP